MTERELKDYYKIFTAYWLIFKKYSSLDGTDSFWSCLIAELGITHRELSEINETLSKDIAVATGQAIQNIYKQKVQEVNEEPLQMSLF